MPKAATLAFWTASFSLAVFAASLSAKAADSTSAPHSTGATWHVTHSDQATLSSRAMAVDPTAIPDCGPTGALTDNGSGFTCMTPAKGDPGPQGRQGPQGSQGPQGPAGAANCNWYAMLYSDNWIIVCTR